MTESNKTEFDGGELYRLAASLLTSINIDKKHLEIWQEYERKSDAHFKPEEITSSIKLYKRLINENIALRHKILKELKKEPHPEFIS